MKKIYKIISISLLGLLSTGCQLTPQGQDDPTLLTEFKIGDKVQSLTNIHYNMKNKKISTINYQNRSFISVCSEFSIDEITTKRIKISDEDGIQYSFIWSGHSRKAGQTLSDNFLLHFGEKCDKKELNKLNENDSYGVEQGIPMKGMSKKGVIFSMGHPPKHANINKNSDYWIYWLSTYNKIGITFNKNDQIVNIKN